MKTIHKGEHRPSAALSDPDNEIVIAADAKPPAIDGELHSDGERATHYAAALADASLIRIQLFGPHRLKAGCNYLKRSPIPEAAGVLRYVTPSVLRADAGWYAILGPISGSSWRSPRQFFHRRIARRGGSGDMARAGHWRSGDRRQRHAQ